MLTYFALWYYFSHLCRTRSYVSRHLTAHMYAEPLFECQHFTVPRYLPGTFLAPEYLMGTSISSRHLIGTSVPVRQIRYPGAVLTPLHWPQLLGSLTQRTKYVSLYIPAPTSQLISSAPQSATISSELRQVMDEPLTMISRNSSAGLLQPIAQPTRSLEGRTPASILISFPFSLNIHANVCPITSVRNFSNHFGFAE